MPPTSRRSSSTSHAESAPQKSQSSKDKGKPRNQWLFLANDEILHRDENVSPDALPTISKLRHPRTGTGVCFVISTTGKVFELQCFDEKFHSWFIGECVHSGGKLYITNEMDPLYLILPYLINAGKKERFMSLDQIVCDEEFPSCDKILSCLEKDQLSLVADVKEIDEEDCFYRYSKTKTLNWLKAKVEGVADMLQVKNVDVSLKGSHSSIFVQSRTVKASRESYVQYAAGLIADYIPLEVEEGLTEHLGLQKESEEEPAQASSPNGEPPAKKAKTSSDAGPLEDYSAGMDTKTKTQNVKLTAAQKRLSKVDKTGMKSISSFFSAKN